MSTTGSFHDRCSHAARYIMSGRTDSRGFDNCFEMFDGDAVVIALLRRARCQLLKHEKLEKIMRPRSLWDAIVKYGSGRIPESWLAAETQWKNEKNLTALSRRLITATERQFQT